MNELPASNTHLSGDEKTATLSGRGFSEQLTLLPQPTAGVGPEISEAERNVAAAESPSATPELLGFDSLQELGRGGMGVVYRARQTSLNRTVALKMILSSEHAGEGARLRFLAEAETIAKVQHPGIVQVYAYGTHKDHPYIALEFIDGGSLDRVLAQETLLPRDAARLVAQVAEAIHVAHQAGIIHRDLKPANVLLANVDRQRGGLKATPKITDFGLSKQINTGEGMTATGVIVGTPSYMAPEQAEGQKSVGPAVDIYALGAILYECLTGRPPFKAATPLDTILQAVSDEPIPPQRLQPTTPKDLDTICLKCLRKDPAKRYASAAALAEDLHNWLAGKPITARPVGRLERGVKWCKCYPAVAALVVVSTLAAIVASGLAAWAIQAEEAAVAERDAKAVALQAEQKALRAETEQRRRAEEQTRLANSVSRFLRQDVLQLADPATQRADQKLQYNADVKLRDVVLRAAQAIEGKFADHPLEEAEIRMTLGLTLLGMGQPDLAARQYERVCELYKKLLGPDDPQTLRGLSSLSRCYTDLGRHAEALALDEATLKLRIARLGPDHSDTLSNVNNVAASYTYLGRHAEALALRPQTLKRQQALLGPEHPDVIRTMHNLANCYFHLDQHAEALELREKTLQLMRAHFGHDHPMTLIAMNNLANSYGAVNQFHEALKLNEETLNVRKAKLGPDHPDTLHSMIGLANSYSDLGRHTEALALREETLKLLQAKLGRDHPDAIRAMNNLANSLARLGRDAEALPLFQETLKLRQGKLGLDDPDTLQSMSNLAWSYSRLGQQDEALKLYQESLKLCQSKLGPGHPSTLFTMNGLGLCYAQQGQDAEAANVFEETLYLRRKKLGPDHPDTLHSMTNLALSYATLDRLPEALKLHEETLAARKRVLPAGHSDIALNIFNIACVHAQMVPKAEDQAKQAEKAMTWLRQAVAAGYNNVADLKQDIDLNALRDREDFK